MWLSPLRSLCHGRLVPKATFLAGCLALAFAGTCDAPPARDFSAPTALRSAVTPAETRPHPATVRDEAGPAVFDPSSEVLLPGTATEHVLAADIAAERRARAARHLDDDNIDALERGRLLWLLATADDRPEVAALESNIDALATLASLDHPLAQPAALLWARRLPLDSPQALSAAALATREPSSQWAEAALLEARIALRQGHQALALGRLATLLTERDASDGRSEQRALHAAAALAEGLAAPGQPPAGRRPGAPVPEPALLRAIALLRKALGQQRIPGGSNALETLLHYFPPRQRAMLRNLTDDEKLSVAAGSREAATALRALFRGRSVREATRCEAGFLAGKRLLSARARDEALEVFRQVNASCSDPSVRARALYNLAREQVRAGNAPAAVSHYAEIERVAPRDPLADDARYKAALTERDEGHWEAFYALLEGIADRYPQGDMRPFARFQLAWRHFEQAREGVAAERQMHLNAALQLFREGADATGVPEDLGRWKARPDLIGRDRYWEGRVLEELGEQESAEHVFASLRDTVGLRYYGWLALNRLASTLPASRRRALVPDCTPWAWRRPFLPRRREDMRDAPFLRALEWLRVRQGAQAAEELARWRGYRDPSARWLVVALLHAADDFADGHAGARRGERFGLEPGAIATQLLYPPAFSSLVEMNAAAASIPSALAWAIMREESGFATRAESRVGARGLMQLMPDTAARFVAPGEDPLGGQDLYDAAVNIRLGTRFLGYLQSRFSHAPFTVPAAYNAGEGATRRWLGAHADRTLDEFVETIPYDETRRYTRRVLSSYAVYACLHRGDIPWLAERP